MAARARKSNVVKNDIVFDTKTFLQHQPTILFLETPLFTTLFSANTLPCLNSSQQPEIPEVDSKQSPLVALSP